MDFSDWIDHGTYYESPYPQGTRYWHDARKRLLTASWAAVCLNQDPFKNLDDLHNYRAGIMGKEIAPENRRYIEHGIVNEPVVRNWYRRTFKVQVEEVGLAVPKWDHRIGASLDGQVLGQSKCLEIKCPQKMYAGVEQYLERKTTEPDLDVQKFIFPTHYAQMQMGMAITSNKDCDYVVYDSSAKKINIVEVPFNPTYWFEELYPAIRQVIADIDGR